MLSVDQLASQSLWKQAAEARRQSRSGEDSFAVARTQTIGALLNILNTDLIEATSDRLEADPPSDLADLRSRTTEYVGFSNEVDDAKCELKRFLSENFYHHPFVLERTRQASSVMGDLFQNYSERPALLPDHVRGYFDREGPLRAISDYIAGMTDRFALDEHTALEARKATAARAPAGTP